mgnify:CR=1 FL=1
MNPKFLPLAATNFATQAVRNPGAFASKVSTRLRGQPLNRPPSPDHNARDFRVPIILSPQGGRPDAVLHVLTNSLPHSTGGYAIRSHEILKAQRGAGISVSAITRLSYPVNVGRIPKGAFELVDGLRYTRALPTVFPPTFPAQVREYAKWIVREASERGATILHTTTPWPNAAATSLAARELGIPWIYEVRGEPEATWAAYQPAESHPELMEYFRLSRSKEEEAMRAAAGVVALSETSTASLRARGIQGSIVVAPNAVAPDWVAKRISAGQVRGQLGLEPRRYVGAVSSVVEYEGFDTLILALHHLPEDVAMLLVGDGTHLPALKELAKREDLSDRVVFTGRQPTHAIAPYYSALDVFVVPRKDSLVTRTVTPMKTLQAHAFGIPVVASDLPALREVTQGEARYVPPGEPKVLASAISAALQGQSSPPLTLPTWADAARSIIGLYSGV